MWLQEKSLEHTGRKPWIANQCRKQFKVVRIHKQEKGGFILTRISLLDLAAEFICYGLGAEYPHLEIAFIQLAKPSLD